MNEPIRYEQIIAEKISQVTVPDMLDDIWGSIESELDGGGGDDGGGQEQPAPKKPTGRPGLKRHWRLIAMTGVIIATLIIFTKRKNNNSHTTIAPVPVPVQQASDSQPHADTSTTSTNNAVIKSPFTGLPVLKDTSGSLPVVIPDSISTFGITDIPLPLKTEPGPPLYTIPQIAKDTVPVKKSRGVKGISDSDYKIVTKKDSL